MYVQQGEGWQLLSCLVHFVKYLNIWTTYTEGRREQAQHGFLPSLSGGECHSGCDFSVMGEGWQLVSCRVHCVQ
jgi:hypothetical protein